MAITTPAAHAAVNGDNDNPHCVHDGADPVGSGFVASLARPGRNATGLSFVPELDFFGKQLELLTEMVPDLSRVIVLWAPANPVHATIVDATKVTAERLGVTALSRPTRTRDEIDRAFAEIPPRNRIAVLVIADFMFVAHLQHLVDLAAQLYATTPGAGAS